MGLFGRNDKEIQKENEKLVKRVEQLETELGAEKTSLKTTIESLERDKKSLKEEVADLELKKKIEEEDIKHMVKIKEEKMDLEYEKKALALEREKDREIAKIKDDYQGKIEKNLEKQLAEVKETTDKIMALVPDINVKLKGQVG